MPTEREIEHGHRLEDALYSIVGLHGKHAMTRTGDGGRTWYFYIDNIDLVRDSIKRFFDAEPPISVKVTVKRDAEWNTITEMLSAVN